MREIKFRAWDEDDKVMFESAIPYGDSVYKLVIIDIEEDRSYLAKIENAILMQYTGLKDKNGKEIFEGETLYTKSIIKQFENELLHEVTGNVVIENGMTYLKGICKHGYLWEEIESRPYRAILLSPEIFEIIGNIHEGDVQEWKYQIKRLI